MQQAYTIRLATAADVDWIFELDRATLNLPHWSRGEYGEAVTSKHSGSLRCVVVAKCSVTPVGFAVARIKPIPGDILAELESVVVDVAARRSGVGAALCRAAIAWCRKESARQIDLEVRSRSEGAIALYLRLGFKAVGRRPGYYRDPEDDAILMSAAI